MMQVMLFMFLIINLAMACLRHTVNKKIPKYIVYFKSMTTEFFY